MELFARVLVLLSTSSIAACTLSAEAGGSGTTAQALAPSCRAAELLTTGSAFAAALQTWSTEPAGSTRGVAELTRACEHSSSSSRGTEQAACTLLGLAYASGAGVPKNQHKAFSYLRRSGTCDGFSFDAMDLAQSADHAIVGRGVACCGGLGCEAGCEATCAAAAEKVRREVEPPLRAACARRQGVACFMLAQLVGGQHIQRVGRVLAEDERSDDALYDLACAAGVGPACVWRGARESEHPATSRRYYERGCAAGWGDACLHIGLDLDVEGKRSRAIDYWEKACFAGLYRACNDLGDILSKGEGIPADHERAVRAYAEAWRVPQ